MKLISPGLSIYTFILLSSLDLSLSAQVKTSTRNIKGQVKIEFSGVKVNVSNTGERTLVANGLSQPGNVIMVRNRKTILVPPSGKFKLKVALPKGPTKLEIQAVSPQGDRSIYNFDLGRLGPSKAEAKRMEKERIKQEQLAAEETERKRLEEEELKKKQMADGEKLKEAQAKQAKLKQARMAKQKAEREKREFGSFPGLFNETSIRASGLLGNEFSLLGQVLVRLWPDDLFDYNSGLLTRQRWGLGWSYSKTFTGDVDYTMMEVPLFYRLYPGQINRYTAFALGASYIKIEHSKVEWSGLSVNAILGAPLVGSLASLVNWVPFLRAPKYLEIDLYVGSSSMSTDVTASGVFGLTGRLKTFYAERFFLDLVSYFKSHTLTKPGLGKREFRVLGGSIGCGYLF